MWSEQHQQHCGCSSGSAPVISPALQGFTAHLKNLAGLETWLKWFRRISVIEGLIWQKQNLIVTLSLPPSVFYLLHPVLVSPFFPELFFSWTCSALQEWPGCQMRISLEQNLAKCTWALVLGWEEQWMLSARLDGAPCSCGRCPCPWQGMRWLLRSFHPKPVCDSINKCSSLLSHDHFVPETQKNLLSHNIFRRKVRMSPLEKSERILHWTLWNTQLQRAAAA